MSEYTTVQLMEKIIRAKIALEKVKSAPHRVTCPMEDPESYAPCNCGASASSGPIQEALNALKL